MSRQVHAVAASRVFDGTSVHEDSAVLIDGGRDRSYRSLRPNSKVYVGA